MIVPWTAGFPTKKETRRLQFPFQDILDGFPRRLWQLCPNGLWGHPDITKMGHSLKINGWNLRKYGLSGNRKIIWTKKPSCPQGSSCFFLRGCCFTPWRFNSLKAPWNDGLFVRNFQKKKAEQVVPSREPTYPRDQACLKMIFLFPRWAMLVSRRVCFFFRMMAIEGNWTIVRISSRKSMRLPYNDGPRRWGDIHSSI